VTHGAGGPEVAIFGRQVPLRGRDLAGAVDLVAGLRPEHLSLGAGPVQFQVRPALIESLGSEKYVYFDAAGHKVLRGDAEGVSSKGLIARISHTGAMSESDEITLSFDPGNLYLFDAKTEKALR